VLLPILKMVSEKRYSFEIPKEPCFLKIEVYPAGEKSLRSRRRDWEYIKCFIPQNRFLNIRIGVIKNTSCNFRGEITHGFKSFGVL